MRKPASRPADAGGVHAETRQRDPSFVMSGHHCHSCYELFYVRSGECRFLTDDRIHDLGAGDFILIPPMTLHYTRYFTGPCVRTVVLFSGEDLAEGIGQYMPGEKWFFSETNLFRVPEANREQAEDILSRMEAEDRKDDVYSVPLSRCALQELLLFCCRTCDFLPPETAGIRTEDRHILNAARFISERYMHPITTGDVARAVGFSPNYLSRRFRTSAGIGLHEYIVFVRLHHAAQQLISTGDSITEIALRCGFSDSNYFKDSFKKKFGVTPRDYRRIT